MLKLCKLLKIIQKMHDLCETKLLIIGYKDINLLIRKTNWILNENKLKLNLK